VPSVSLLPLSATAQSNNYGQVNLVSSAAELGLVVDPALASPLRLAFSAGQQIRVANNKTGNFRSYDATGRSLIFAGDIAVALGVTTGTQIPRASPRIRRLCLHHTAALQAHFFLQRKMELSPANMRTRKGNIPATTILAVDNSTQGAIYTGIAPCLPPAAALHFWLPPIFIAASSIRLPDLLTS
jgi:hypothetical protein